MVNGEFRQVVLNLRYDLTEFPWSVQNEQVEPESKFRDSFGYRRSLFPL